MRLLIGPGTKGLTGGIKLVFGGIALAAGLGLMNDIQNGCPLVSVAGSALGAMNDAQNGFPTADALAFPTGPRNAPFSCIQASGVSEAAGLIGIPEEMRSFDNAGHREANLLNGFGGGDGGGAAGSLAVLRYFFRNSSNGFGVALISPASCTAGALVVIGIPRDSSSF